MFAISTDGLERWGVLGLLMGGLRNNLLLLQNFDLDDIEDGPILEKVPFSGKDQTTWATSQTSI